MGEPAAKSTSPPRSPAEVQPFGRLGVHVLHRARAVRRELDRLGRLLGHGVDAADRTLPLARSRFFTLRAADRAVARVVAAARGRVHAHGDRVAAHQASPNCITGIPSSRLRSFRCGCAFISGILQRAAPLAVDQRRVVDLGLAIVDRCDEDVVPPVVAEVVDVEGTARRRVFRRKTRRSADALEPVRLPPAEGGPDDVVQGRQRRAQRARRPGATAGVQSPAVESGAVRRVRSSQHARVGSPSSEPPYAGLTESGMGYRAVRYG